VKAEPGNRPHALRTPIALLIFNRPDFTARVLEAVAAARSPALFVVGDGPRPGRPEDERLVAEARAVIDRVDWDCEVLTSYSEINLGCDRSIARGLDWVFDTVREAIILEDDCVPDQSFFPYCEQLLERYRDDERVQMIGGSNPVGARGAYSYHFSWSYPVWGWASWARAWRHYDHEMGEWPRLRETDWLESRLGDRRAAKLARYWFDGTHAAPIRQWDFLWTFSGWLRDAVAATPSVNLVSNIGYGENATHLRDRNHPFANVPAQSIDFPLRHPPRVEVLDAAERAAWDVLVARFARARRAGSRRRMAGYLAAGVTKLSSVRESAARAARIGH
jgi:hypothetical protein